MPRHLRLQTVGRDGKYSSAAVLQNLNVHGVATKLQDILSHIIHCLGLRNIRKSHFNLHFFMVALCNRADHYIFILFLSSSSSFFFFLLA